MREDVLGMDLGLHRSGQDSRGDIGADVASGDDGDHARPLHLAGQHGGDGRSAARLGGELGPLVEEAERRPDLVLA